MRLMSISAIKNQQIKKRFQEIYTHEQAHKRAGGALAGAIVIEKNAQGIPIGGHVSIKMPTLNPRNPQRAINNANTVIDAALAPSDPSPQDLRVAAQAKSIKAQAERMQSKNQKGLDYYA